MRKVFIRFLVVLFLGKSVASYAFTSENGILSVDIGSTRVKAALLSTEMSIEDLQKISILTFPSENWLGPDISHFLDPHFDMSLAVRFSPASYQSISLLMSCDIWQNKINLSRSSMPKDLQACLGQYSSKTLFIENDMVGFARGALYLQKLLKNPIRYPCVCISLGTGAAASVCESASDFTIVMLHKVNQDFHRLRSVVRTQTNSGPGSGSLMGRAFFQWVKEAYPCCSEQKVQTIFQERFNAFLQDLLYPNQFKSWSGDGIESRLKSTIVSGPVFLIQSHLRSSILVALNPSPDQLLN